MDLPKNSLLTDIIDVLALSNTQQDKLENIISNVETKFVERGRSTKTLLNKIEYGIQMGIDLGLLIGNKEDNTIRLKFNPNIKSSISLSRYQGTDENCDDTETDDNSDSSDDNKKTGYISGSESDEEYIIISDEEKNNSNDEYKKKPSSIRVPSKYKAIAPNQPPLSKSNSRSVHHTTATLEKPKKRKSADNNSQRRTRIRKN